MHSKGTIYVLREGLTLFQMELKFIFAFVGNILSSVNIQIDTDPIDNSNEIWLAVIGNLNYKETFSVRCSYWLWF